MERTTDNVSNVLGFVIPRTRALAPRYFVQLHSDTWQRHTLPHTLNYGFQADSASHLVLAVTLAGIFELFLVTGEGRIRGGMDFLRMF